MRIGSGIVYLPFLGILLFRRFLFRSWLRGFLFLGFLGYYGHVGSLPVVHVLTLAPLSLESSLALLHGHRVIKIPCRGSTWLNSGLRLSGTLEGTRLVLGDNLLAFQLGLSVSLLLFLALQLLYHPIDGSVALCL